MAREKEIDNWNQHWENFDETLGKSPAQFYRFRQVMKETRFAANGRENLCLLDVGCGQGELLKILHDHFPSFTFGGIEYSEFGAGLSKQRMPNSKIIQGDLIANSLSLREFDRFADILTCSEVLEHVDDPALFLRNCRPLMKNNGFLVVTVPGGFKTAFDVHLGHRKHFTHQDLDQLMQENGFTVIHNRQAGFPFHNLYRIVLKLRGESLRADVNGKGTWAVNFAMKIFEILFHLNLDNTRYGWQNVVLAKKAD